MLLFSVRIHLEWLYWRQRSGLIGTERISKREARDILPPLHDELNEWQRVLEVELRSLGRQHDLVSLPKVAISHVVPNAASDGQRIHMNPTWARETTKAICGTDGACKQALMRGVAAHELAHHLRDGAVTNPHEEELRADAWAARSLSQLGISVEPYIRLVGAGPELSSATHPAPAQRRRAVHAAVQAAAVVPIPVCSTTSCCATCESDSQPQASGVYEEGHDQR